jgi:hypothetical protein
MNYESYNAVSTADDLSSFDFVSAGKKGEIRKRIIFMPTALSDVYALAFGNITENGEIDDLSITDNGDRNKILATVAAAVDIYTKRHQDRMIYFIGSTKQRTRLYRMAVGLNLDELSRTYDIYAEPEKGFEFKPFHKNMEINAFLIKRKPLNSSLAKCSPFS